MSEILSRSMIDKKVVTELGDMLIRKCPEKGFFEGYKYRSSERAEVRRQLRRISKEAKSEDIRDYSLSKLREGRIESLKASTPWIISSILAVGVATYYLLR